MEFESFLHRPIKIFFPQIRKKIKGEKANKQKDEKTMT